MIVVLVALVVVAGFGVFALIAQRDALDKVVRMAAEQSRVDANERHVLANRIQHPSLFRPEREPPAPRIAPPVAPGGGEMAGRIMPNLSAEEFENEFLKFDGDQR